MEVSVIIPMHNSVSTIEKAIKSINLSLNYEIICVDDGSTDTTKLKIEELQLVYPIKYIYQKNSGAASARNKGLDSASGEYVIFLDSDDTYINKSIEKMFAYAKNTNADVVIGNMAHKINGRLSTINTYNSLFTTSKLTTLKETPAVLQSIGPVAKLYKRAYIRMVRFDESVTFCEEHTFNCNIFKSAKIYILNEIVYIYNKDNQNSTVTQSGRKLVEYLNDAIKVRKKVINILKDEPFDTLKYYEYRMDKLIVFFLIKNNYMYYKNKTPIIDEMFNYISQSNMSNPDILDEFKKLYLTIASTISFRNYIEYAKKLNFKVSTANYLIFIMNDKLNKAKFILKKILRAA